MSTFIVSLPNYDYSQPFNTEAFIRLFPGSLITLALQSGEQVIPLENPAVTPEILQLLLGIITTQDIPYISTPGVKKALDYLGIDLPEFVYNPLYARLRQQHPNFTLSKVDEYYRELMIYSIDRDLPELAQYILDNTGAELHRDEDNKLISYYIWDAKHAGRPAYIEGADHILPLIVRERKTPSMQYHAIGAVSNGYIQLVDLINAQDYGSSVVTSAFGGITDDPEHYEKHIAMVEHVQGLPEHYEKHIAMVEHVQGLAKAWEMRFTEAYRAILSDQLLGPQELPYISQIIPALLYVAMFTGKYDTFRHLFTTSKKSGNASVRNANETFLRSYFNHPKIITPENLQLVKSLLSYGDLYQWYEVLSRAGYTDYANFLLQ